MGYLCGYCGHGREDHGPCDLEMGCHLPEACDLCDCYGFEEPKPLAEELGPCPSSS